MRNASVELMRFLAAVGVVLVHFEQFCGVNGPIFDKVFVVVEFFFIVTGYYMMKSIDHKTTEPAMCESIANSYYKAKKIFGLYIFTFILVFITRIVVNNITDVGEMLSQLWHFKWELFMLQMMGFNQDPQFNMDYLIAPGWYLSALFIALVPAYYLARNHTRAFAGIIGPVSVLLIYCYIMQNYGTLDVGNEIVGETVMLGLLRAFGGITFGALVYFLYKRLSALSLSKMQLSVLNILEVICWLMVLLLVVLHNYLTSQDTLAYLAVFAALIICSDLNVTALDKFFNKWLHGICCYLGRLSMYTYLLHIIVVSMWAKLLPGCNGWWTYFAVLGIVIVFSSVVMTGEDKLKARSKSIAK